jgi:hypothetical protein
VSRSVKSQEGMSSVGVIEKCDFTTSCDECSVGDYIELVLMSLNEELED